MLPAARGMVAKPALADQRASMRQVDLVVRKHRPFSDLLERARRGKGFRG